MNGEYLLYLQEIKSTEWVIELISEQFDDAMNMMTPNSVIYGGAVRDCLAGKDLIGDLDIAVSASECTNMVNKFVKNPKWVNVSNNRMNESHYKMFSSSPSFFGSPSRKSVFQTAPQIMTFRTLGNKTVQIIVLSPINDDPFQTVTTMVKQVDIVCCGVILTNDNKVFEVVPNAYKDCKKHVLHLNNACYVKDIEHFKQRIEKLSERGWVNEININKVIRTVNRKRKQIIEREKILAGITKHASTGLEDHTHTIEKSNFVNSNNKATLMENGYVVLKGPYTQQEGATGAEIKYNYAKNVDKLSHTGYRSILSGSDIGYIGGLSEALYSLETIAKKYRLDIIVQPVKNCLVVITRDRHLGDQVYDRVMNRAKHFKVITPLSNKKLKDIVPPLCTATTDPSMKIKHKLGTSKKVHDKPEAATMTPGQLYAQSPFSTKHTNTRTERYFRYSTDAERSATPFTNKYYTEIPRSVIERIGGIAMMLHRLERVARSAEIDVGAIIEGGIATIITKDANTRDSIYGLLTKNSYASLKEGTKSSGGTIKWR